MKEGKVRCGEHEYSVFGTLSLGRTPDNDVSFADDGNISRNHAQIQTRPDGFYVVDLGSSNGTAVNGIPIQGESKLQNGDYIILGNSGTVTFHIEGEDEPEIEEADATGGTTTAAADGPSSKSNKYMLAGAAGLLGMALIVGGGAYYFTSGSSCHATAKIVSPEVGETIIAATEIEVETDKAGCVATAKFTLDGIEFAKSDEQPFTATLDPNEHPDLADGLDHALSIVLLDRSGGIIYQPAPVLLAFDTRKVKQQTDGNVAVNNNGQTAPTGPKGKQPSLIQIQEMTKNLVKQFSGNFRYNVSNTQFLQEVQKKTAEYAQPGYFARAAQYRDAINIGFVREQNLDPALGFYLAMSRSKFDPTKQGSDEGIFRMSNDFVTSNAYNGSCGSETISDKAQNCAARAAGLYMKALVFGVFEGDPIYGAVAFGRSPQDAGVWKASLPANRSDLWNVIKTAPEREQLVRLFAAGIVAENPQSFGLTNDRPISELYRTAM